jgi:hypothetical protein
MDLFKFNPVSSNWTYLDNASSINGLTSTMWIERYRAPGEFQIKAKLSSGLINDLPLGALISHIGTWEVMMVENQEITQDKDSDAMVTISGRTMYSWLENRIVGTNQVRQNSVYVEYTLPADYTWNQALKLINDHIYNTVAYDDMLGNVVAANYVSGITSISTARTIKRMDVLKATLDLLEVDDLGLRTIRVSVSPNRPGSNTHTMFVIYKGYDRTNYVVFSWDKGDIVGADYLWSNKSTKTSAMVVGSKLNIIQDDKVPFAAGRVLYDRKTTVVDGSDIDSNYTGPADPLINDYISKMRIRANQAVANNNQISITRLDVAPQTRWVYRRDYNLGDLVMVEGNFNVRMPMRVTEHVEIMDENGTSGHPTLALPLA